MTEGASTTTGSTVPRRQLGRHLRDLRNRSRLTVRAAAAKLEWSEAKIWRHRDRPDVVAQLRRGDDVQGLRRTGGPDRRTHRAGQGDQVTRLVALL